MIKPCNRRTFIRNASVLLALPSLESLHGATSRPAGKPKRMVFICSKLGLYAPCLFPKGKGKLEASSEYLKLLADHLADTTLFSGLSHDDQSGRLSHSSEATWLTAARNPGLDGFQNTQSVDQLAADLVGYETRFPSLVLSTEGEASQSYTKNGVMIPAESSPSRLFSRLFLKGKPNEIKRQKMKLAKGKSILDGLLGETRSVKQKSSSSDQRMLDDYFESIRSLERELKMRGEWLEKPVPVVNASKPTDVADKRDIIGRLSLMMEIIPLILATDSTRIINLGIQVDHGVLKMKGVNEEHHSLSHHGQDPEKIRQLKIVESAILKRLSDLLTRLKKDEGQGCLLDSTCLLFGSNLGNANNHDYRNLPILLAGGGLGNCKHVSFNREKNVPLCNLFLTMLNQSGFPVEQFGQSTSKLSWN